MICVLVSEVSDFPLGQSGWESLIAPRARQRSKLTDIAIISAFSADVTAGDIAVSDTLPLHATEASVFNALAAAIVEPSLGEDLVGIFCGKKEDLEKYRKAAKGLTAVVDDTFRSGLSRLVVCGPSLFDFPEKLTYSLGDNSAIGLYRVPAEDPDYMLWKGRLNDSGFLAGWLDAYWHNIDSETIMRSNVAVQNFGYESQQHMIAYPGAVAVEKLTEVCRTAGMPLLRHKADPDQIQAWTRSGKLNLRAGEYALIG